MSIHHHECHGLCLLLAARMSLRPAGLGLTDVVVVVVLTRQLTHRGRARRHAHGRAVRGHDIALRRVCLALPCLALLAVQRCRLQCSTHCRDIKIRVPVSASPTALCSVRASLAASCCPTAMLFPSVLISPKVSRPHASRVNPGCYRIAVGYPNSAHAPMPRPFCLAPVLGAQKRGRAVWPIWLLSAWTSGAESFSWNFFLLHAAMCLVIYHLRLR